MKTHFCHVFVFFKQSFVFFNCGDPERPLWFLSRTILCQYNILGKYFRQPSGACCRKPPNKNSWWKTVPFWVKKSKLASEGTVATTIIDLLFLLCGSWLWMVPLPRNPNCWRSALIDRAVANNKASVQYSRVGFSKALKGVRHRSPFESLVSLTP